MPDTGFSIFHVVLCFTNLNILLKEHSFQLTEENVFYLSQLFTSKQSVYDNQLHIVYINI